MSPIEGIKNFLSFNNHDLIVYNIIIGSILGGIIVDLTQASFKDNFPNIIELIIGTMLLMNEKFNSVLRSLGFILTADSFSFLTKKKSTPEKCKDCMPFECLKIIPMYVTTNFDLVVYGNNEPIPIPSECKKYYQEYIDYIAYVPLPPIPDPKHKQLASESDQEISEYSTSDTQLSE